MAGYDSHLRFRCSREDKAKFIKIAKELRRKPSDLARIILEDYVAAKERALGLPPLTPQEIDQLVEADEPAPARSSASATAGASRPAKPLPRRGHKPN